MTTSGASPDAHAPPRRGRPAPDGPGSSPWRPRAAREVRAFAELLAVTGLAIAQPLLDIFGRAPDQFIFRGASDQDIIMFAVVLVLGPALVAYVLEVVVGLVSELVRKPLHLAFLFAGLTAFAIQLLRSLTTGPLLILLALAVGAAASYAYVRAKPVRLWLSFLSLASPVFAVLFLFGSQTSVLLSDPASVGEVRVGDPAPVVMIVFDELPLTSLVDTKGNIDASLYPNFAELADTSHWFRNTTAVSNFTWNAVPSIVTGDDPRDDTVPTAASHPESIFTLLGSSMGLDVTESVTQLCPTDLCAVSKPRDGGLSGLLGDARRVLKSRLSPNPISDNPAAGLIEGGASPGDAKARQEDNVDASIGSSQRARQFLDGISDQTNTLHYLHVLLPHIPFRFLPDGTEYDAPTPEIGRTDDTWGSSTWLVELNRQRHLMQLQRADALLGETIAKMKKVGIYDQAVLTVVADHGMSFQADQSTRGLDLTIPMTDSVASEIMWVPFFVKEPEQDQGVVDDRNVMTTDVLPTIADVLDTKVPWELDGQSALGPARQSSAKGLYLADGTIEGVLAGDRYDLDAKTGYELVLSHSFENFVPPGDGPDRLFLVGPAPELVGIEVADAGDGSLTAVDATLDPASDASDVQPDSGRVPALVRATLIGAEVGDDLAIVVNGTVRATAPAYADGKNVALAAMVPRGSFEPGANQIEIYRIAVR